MFYISNKKRVEEFIEKANLDPRKVKDKYEMNCLIISIIGKKKDTVEMLIDKYKVNINHKDKFNVPPLVADCFINHKAIAGLSIKKRSKC